MKRTPIKYEQTKAQAILEFTFTMIILMLMIFAIVRVLQWSGATLAERRIAHENSIIKPVVENYNLLCGRIETRPMDQVEPNFYDQQKIRAIWRE